MNKYRISFYGGDVWHTDLLKRVYLEFENEAAARSWAVSQGVSEWIEILKVR